ncbi:Probable glycosyltransferase [Flavobacteriaceae bacterium 3519-10]|nr:Probable glycosyltransferase [Flavobacteriaceae bacterium 3519-10]
MSVTVAIPFFNAEKYLADSIKSVFAQTFEDWELLLIDDGSTDNSLSIAKSVNDPRVRVLSDGLNKKLACRLNEVTRIAKYDLIARMDADDLMSPNRLKTQIDILNTNPDYDLVTTGVYSVMNDLTLVGKRGSSFKDATFDEIISRKKGVTHAALMARKNWYERNKYDETLTIAQDLDLWVRSSFNNDLKIISVDEPLYIYREEGNVTSAKILRAYKNERRLIKKYVGLLNPIYIKSMMKTLAVTMMDIFSIKRDMQAKRNIEVGPQERYNYEQNVQRVKSIRLPLQ